MKTELILTPDQVQKIEQDGVAAYPNECCGVLIGIDISASGITRRIVQRLESLPNSFESGEQFHRFSLNPLDLARAEKQAGAEGKLVLGFYHSHPDHPARPSEYDRMHAWPYYSYVIVSIGKGEPIDLTSWQLDDQTETFGREDIIVDVPAH